MPLELGFLEALRGGATGVREAIDFRTAEAIRQADINRALQEERDRDERRAAQRQAEMTANQKFQEKLLREELKHKDKNTIQGAIAAAGPQTLSRYLKRSGKSLEGLGPADAAAITAMNANRAERRDDVEGLKAEARKVGASIANIPRGKGYRQRVEAAIETEVRRQNKAQEDLLNRQQSRLENPPATPSDPLTQYAQIRRAISSENANLLKSLEDPVVSTNTQAVASVRAQIDRNNEALKFFEERAGISTGADPNPDPIGEPQPSPLLVREHEPAIQRALEALEQGHPPENIARVADAAFPGMGDHILDEARRRRPGMLSRAASSLNELGAPARDFTMEKVGDPILRFLGAGGGGG